MTAHPVPPTLPGDRADFEQQYAKEPDRWFRYLSKTYAWMKDQAANQADTDRKLIELQVRVQTLQEEALVARRNENTAVAQRSWIEERLNAKEKELMIAQIEAHRAIDSALPTVATPTPSATPDPLAKAPTAETLGAPLPPITRSTASTQLSERIPDPDKFKATRTDLRRFHYAITEKLTVNLDRYPTAVSRMAYVNSRLNDESYKLIQPYIFRGVCRLPDYHNILDILQKAYRDPNQARTARRKLNIIRQRDRDFATFYAEFQSLSLDSSLEGDALAPFLKKAVSRELYEMLLNNPPADYGYQTLVKHFQNLDIRLQEHHEGSRLRQHYGRNPFRPGKGIGSPLRERANRKSPSPPRGRSPPKDLPAGDPMDLSNQRRPRNPNYRRENNQCFRCGSSTHYIRGCPEPDTRPR
ncbi:hypothetical protein S7711_09667 [Stachybotrys chartarum IBT 7711]|uniref:CCHC-type domain-containing protein n=1 Tax=Stachybotrys chartarum (strain CBS 109288 / IBT 7711) TaxID=1280523 RepID=A0A084BBE8_STACB|nr:hypothetical protein S7711_09667 [Stachybotrys chartarum IBT 7711]KFA51081.1 hypothetical protein S40293_10218 [Stachybotrys chartarum IBT 40293]KFA81758.1 hypothetical protein S40288_09975 [Stachybotrys chartarum IBT 40288]